MDKQSSYKVQVGDELTVRADALAPCAQEFAGETGIVADTSNVGFGGIAFRLRMEDGTLAPRQGMFYAGHVEVPR